MLTSTDLLTMLRWRKVCRAQTIAGIPRQVLDNFAPTLSCFHSIIADKLNSFQFIRQWPQSWQHPICSAPSRFSQTLSKCYKKRSNVPLNITYCASFYKISWPVLSGEAKPLWGSTHHQYPSDKHLLDCHSTKPSLHNLEIQSKTLANPNSERWRWWFLLTTSR